MHQHRMTIQQHESMVPYLRAIGLYQVAQLKCMDIDPGLITALVERWRPETHTFHLPVGELTVTLQDVSILWGLPIRGLPITGRSDDEWSQVIEDAFGDFTLKIFRDRKSTNSTICYLVHIITLRVLCWHAIFHPLCKGYRSEVR